MVRLYAVLGVQRCFVVHNCLTYQNAAKAKAYSTQGLELTPLEGTGYAHRGLSQNAHMYMYLLLHVRMPVRQVCGGCAALVLPAIAMSTKHIQYGG